MKILLVSYHFAPEMTVCAHRPDSLYKYALRNGDEVDVITAADSGEQLETGMYRFGSIKGWKKGAGLFIKAPFKLLTKLVEPFFFNIDIFWIFNGWRNFSKRISASDYDVVYSVYPQISSLILGYLLSGKSKTAFVADLTDGITVEPLSPPNLVQKWSHRLFEKKLFNRAAAVITIAEYYRAYYSTVFPETPVHLVYNGYDPDDFSGLSLQPATAEGPVQIVHFGNICASRKRDVAPLFKGIHRMKERLGSGCSGFTVVFIGIFTKEERAYVNRYNLEDCVSFREPVKKTDGFQLITSDFDYLLFYGAQGLTGSVSSKLLEYLRLGKPVLGICRGNEAADIIQRSGCGEVVGFLEEEVEEILEKACSRSIQYHPDTAYIESFSRVSQSKAILSVLSNLFAEKAE